ncbi:heat shock 70 kDa protein-like [Planoprotostelium fungivorum]|uniref:Heat shock 70 kDa protein-like n=1 Tax=Planoprotostelium fungivorum TaxID=1890364 RepID=A0A2P6NP46_9EUKA|nr:heat shock 70 kDa protein-like [Planoprotostelium fungivorum]
MNVPVGIDLGTTYSCVGAWLNGRVEIISNDQGQRITPSYVAFTDSERLLGNAAYNQASFNAENTVFDVKRLIGRSFSDPLTQADIIQWPFKVVSGRDDRPLIEVQYQGQQRLFTAEEVSAMVLTKMKETAETFVGHSVRDVVVTVPAYFNDSQRQATKDAASIAGLNVVRIMNEPTAAAVAYGYDRGTERKNILVFDLGGGTLDVSLLKVENGTFSVFAVSGDTHLGGEDFDSRLVHHFANEFKMKKGKDIGRNPKALRRLRTACERVKRELSTQTRSSLEIDALYDGEDFAATITRAKFEELNRDLFDRCLAPVAVVLMDSGLRKEQVDDVVLVGGSSRIPKIQIMLKDFFDGRELKRSVNPDEAVAHGATVMAAILAGNQKRDDHFIQDVAPLSLGVETIGGVMSVLIARNSRVPTEKSQMVSTTSDYQSSVLIQIYEGEMHRTSSNNLLGKFELGGIQPARRGIPQILVTFRLDEESILYVSATECSSGRSQNLTIKNDKGRLSSEDIGRMVREAEEFKSRGLMNQRRLEARNYLQQMAFAYGDTIRDMKITATERVKLQKAIEDTLMWIDDNPSAEEDEFDYKRELLERIFGVVHDGALKRQQEEETRERQEAEQRRMEEERRLQEARMAASAPPVETNPFMMGDQETPVQRTNPFTEESNPFVIESPTYVQSGINLSEMTLMAQRMKLSAEEKNKKEAKEADDMMENCLSAVRNATQRLTAASAQRMNQRLEADQDGEDLKMETNSSTLRSCSSLASAVTALVQAAAAAQKLIGQKKSDQPVYNADRTWENGFISASRSIVESVQQLEVATSSETIDPALITAAARSVASCTVQLIMSYRSKLGEGLPLSDDLDVAARAVSRAARDLADMMSRRGHDDVITVASTTSQDTSGVLSLRERIEKQARIDRLERELEEARREQGQMRRSEYSNANLNAGDAHLQRPAVPPRRTSQPPVPISGPNPETPMDFGVNPMMMPITKPTLRSRSNSLEKEFYSLEELQRKPSPTGTDLNNLEMYLSEEEFEKVFGMKKEEWKKMPLFRRNPIKQQLRLV